MTSTRTDPATATEATAVRAKGRPILLDDGTQVVIRVDLDNLWEIEERYGSIQALSDALSGLADEPEAGPDGKPVGRRLFRPLIEALAVLMPWQREDLRDARTLRRALDPARFADYLTAAIGSLGDAISTGQPGPQDGQGNVQTAATPTPAGSPGDSSTTPAPSSSVAPTTPSGG